MARVLICDDSNFIRDRIKKMLEEHGHEIVGEASDGLEAVDIYKKVSPDIVTMDIIMKVGGIEAIKQIMEFDVKAKILIVSMMDGNQSDVVEGIRSGALGYVGKPINKEVLNEEIKRVMEV